MAVSAERVRRPARRLRALCASVVAVLSPAACGSDDPVAVEHGQASVTQPSTTEPSDGEAVDSRLVGFTAELIINRQRDLIDRGLINVLTHNDTGHDIRVADRRLIAEHFDTTPAETRISNLPDTRQIALQIPYGTASDCETETAVTATLEFVYTVGVDLTPSTASVELGGTDILDEIRAKQCAAMTFASSTSVSLHDSRLVDGAVAASLTVENTGDAIVALGRTFGTILVGVVTADESTPVTIEAGETADIEITFVVNRCDPHAMAEVTKRYGLAIDVSIAGAAAQLVPIDVATVVAELDAIVQECREANE